MSPEEQIEAIRSKGIRVVEMPKQGHFHVYGGESVVNWYPKTGTVYINGTDRGVSAPIAVGLILNYIKCGEVPPGVKKR